jgi:sensor domain CHASE-containing protein
MHIRPALKILLTTIVAFFATYFTIKYISTRIEQREQQVHLEATKTIQEEIKERFNLVLDMTLVIGQMSSAFIYDKEDKDYEHIFQNILAEKKYLIGLNKLDSTGKIIGTYPKEYNHKAQGKISQNYEELIESYKRGDKYWFSPPFELYQGGAGFVFYIPIEKNGKFLGWMAPVISSQKFFESFRAMDFFNDYELIIKDDLTGKMYFTSAVPPENESLKVAKSEIRRRNISFLTWPKASNKPFALSFAWQLVICLLTSLFAGQMMKLHLQKKKAYSRLENISDLLKLTSNEALAKLMDIQTEYLSLGATGYLSTSVVEKDVQSVTNMIEQIELLQNIASTEHIDEEVFEILPVLKENISNLKEVIKKKYLNLNIDETSFKDIKVAGNKWLISNSVLKNALFYCALVSRPSGKIEITHTQSSSECCTIFKIEKIYEDVVHKAFKTERRLLLARNVMDLLNGKIDIMPDGEHGLIVKLTIKPQ